MNPLKHTIFNYFHLVFDITHKGQYKKQSALLKDTKAHTRCWFIGWTQTNLIWFQRRVLQQLLPLWSLTCSVSIDVVLQMCGFNTILILLLKCVVLKWQLCVHKNAWILKEIHHKNKKLIKDTKNHSMSYLQRSQTTMEIQIQFYSHILSILCCLNLFFSWCVYKRVVYDVYFYVCKVQLEKKNYSVISLKQINNGGHWNLKQQ